MLHLKASKLLHQSQHQDNIMHTQYVSTRHDSYCLILRHKAKKKKKKQEPIRLMYTCFKCVTSDVCNNGRITNDKLTQEQRKKQ